MVIFILGCVRFTLGVVASLRHATLAKNCKSFAIAK